MASSRPDAAIIPSRPWAPTPGRSSGSSGGLGNHRTRSSARTSSSSPTAGAGHWADRLHGLAATPAHRDCAPGLGGVSTGRSRVSEMDGRCYNPPVMMRYLRERGDAAPSDYCVTD